MNAAFFFSYVFARVLIMGMLILRNYQIQQHFDISSDPKLIYICAIISTVLQVVLYVIQLWWFQMIAATCMRTMVGGSKKATIDKRDE